MLKRYQVLINDWLADYAKFISEKYDWSFSEAIRLTMCVSTINWAAALYPDKFRTRYTYKKLVGMMKRYQKAPDMLDESFKSELSKIYFEARKAAEFIIAQEKNRKRR